MFEKFKTTEYLKNLKKEPTNEKFLAFLKLELTDYVKTNPLTVESTWNLNIFKVRLAPVFAAVLIMVLLSGTGVTLASKDSLPGEPLYPIKMLKEDIAAVLIRKAAPKEKFQAKLAAKRLEEIKVLMAEKDMDPRGLDIAIKRLEKHTESADKIIKQENDKGRNIDNTFKAERFQEKKRDLSQIMENRKREISEKEDALITKLKDAEERGEKERVNNLKNELKKSEDFKLEIERAKKKLKIEDLEDEKEKKQK